MFAIIKQSNSKEASHFLQKKFSVSARELKLFFLSPILSRGQGARIQTFELGITMAMAIAMAVAKVMATAIAMAK